MLRNYYINRDWMVSATSQRVYRCAAALSLVLFFILVVKPSPDAIPEALIPVFRLLFFAGILGAAVTMVAMEYFLFGFDKSSATKKVFWFCVILLPTLGPSLYCFFVYLRSDAIKTVMSSQTGGSPH